MNSPGLHSSQRVVRGRRPAGMGALRLFREPGMAKQKGGKLCKWQTRIRQVKFLALKLRLWWAAAGRSPWACSAWCQPPAAARVGHPALRLGRALLHAVRRGCKLPCNLLSVV